MTTTIPDHIVNMPSPAGATEVCSWDDPSLINDPTARRYFQGTQRFIDRSDDEYNLDLVVELWGTQSHQGDVYRCPDALDVREERRGQVLRFSTVARLRAFGEAVIAAADEWEQMAS